MIDKDDKFEPNPRDVVAMVALHALLSALQGWSLGAATKAYEIADAMVEESKK